MITLKTTEPKTFNEPFGVFKPLQKHIYITIDAPVFLGNTKVTVSGYYYYLDDDNKPVKLRDITKSPLDKEVLHQIQSQMLPPLGSELLFDLVGYLMEKLTILTLQQEAQAVQGANWGITGQGDVELVQ